MEAYNEQMRNFMERMSGKFADRMDELSQKMQEAYQRYQELQQPPEEADPTNAACRASPI